jgi:hypothetical protein
MTVPMLPFCALLLRHQGHLIAHGICSGYVVRENPECWQVGVGNYGWRYIDDSIVVVLRVITNLRNGAEVL